MHIDGYKNHAYIAVSHGLNKRRYCLYIIVNVFTQNPNPKAKRGRTLGMSPKGTKNHTLEAGPKLKLIVQFGR